MACIGRLARRQPLHADVRIIAASNVDLKGLAHAGKFREDLLYRPAHHDCRECRPCANRGGDLQILAGHFLAKLASQYRRPEKRLAPSSAAMQPIIGLEIPRAREPAPSSISLQQRLWKFHLMTPAERAAVSRSAREAADKDFSLSFNAAKACAIEEFERSYVAWR